MKFRQVFLALLLAMALPGEAEVYMEIPSEDRDAQPVKPPAPVYPILAAYFGISGRCDVRFNVDARGFSRHIKAFCTHQVFCKSATDAVADVVFEPKIKDGRRVQRRNVVYPLWYSMSRPTDAPIEDPVIAAKELRACESAPIS